MLNNYDLFDIGLQLCYLLGLGIGIARVLLLLEALRLRQRLLIQLALLRLDLVVSALVLDDQVEHQLSALVDVLELDRVELHPCLLRRCTQGLRLLALLEVHLLGDVLERHPDAEVEHVGRG